MVLHYEDKASILSLANKNVLEINYQYDEETGEEYGEFPSFINDEMNEITYFMYQKKLYNSN